MRWGGLALGLCLAVFVAYLVGTGAHMQMFLYGAILFLIVGVIVLGRRAWVLIPLGWYLSATTAVLPFSLSIRDMGVLLSICAYASYRVLSSDPMHQRMRALDSILLVNLLYLAATLVIHPVGFYRFGAETIGARSVFNIVLAAAAYWVIVRLPHSQKIVARTPLYLLVGALVISFLYLTSYLFPGLPARLPYLYAALDIETFWGSKELAGELPRYKRLGEGGLALVLVLCSYYPPRVLLNPWNWRFYLLLVGMLGILASGFRNHVLIAGAYLCISGWLHQQWREMVIAGVAGGLLLVGVVLGQGRLYNLPLAAQRALAFLPGQWSPVVVEDTQTSIKVRFEWWREIIEEREINNWWIGDGFGTRVQDLTSEDVRSSTLGMMTTLGAFHNGPLTTIRYCGVFGLILYYVMAIGCAVSAVRCARRAQGTALQPLAIFLAAQLVWAPIHFTLIFGAYNIEMPQLIMLAGFVRLLIRMLDEQPAVNAIPAVVTPHVPLRRASAPA